MIVFYTSNRVYRMNPDGSHVVPVTAPGVASVDWFPDGRLLCVIGQVVDGLFVGQHSITTLLLSPPSTGLSST